MENLDDLNEMYVDKLLPNIIWMFVCFITGTVGNTLVLLVYGLRMQTKIENGRYFIPVLSLIDLLSSTFGCIHGLFNYFFRMNYPSNSLCKFFNFGSFFTSALSAHTLLLIAIERYRKICVPLGKQMDLFWKRASFAVTLVFSFSYSLPVCFTAGLVNEHLNITNKTASLCGINHADFPYFNQIYFSAVFLVALSNIVAVTVLYSRIACSIYKHSSRRHSSPGGTRLSRAILQKDDSKSKHSEQSLETDLEESHTSTVSFNPAFKDNDMASVELKQFNKITPPHVTAEYLDNNFSKADDNENSIPARTFQRDRKNPKAKKWNKTKVKFNIMFGVIIIFYLLAYVPNLTLLVVASSVYLNIDLNVFEFLNRLYIINNIVNPFVYGYFDVCFRHSLKSLVTCKQ